jgi:hypothetical protein
MGIGVQGLSDEERGHRDALPRKLLSEAQPYSPEVLPHIIPGLGPHPEAPASSQFRLTIEAEIIHAASKRSFEDANIGSLVEGLSSPLRNRDFFPPMKFRSP